MCNSRFHREVNKIQWIDLVVCNLYPFSKTISQEDCNLALALENVDIGGPTMIRSAAKNLGWVCVVVDPLEYSTITDELQSNGQISFETRRKFSSKERNCFPLLSLENLIFFFLICILPLIRVIHTLIGFWMF